MSYAEFLDLFFHQERQACTGSGLEKQFIGMTPGAATAGALAST